MSNKLKILSLLLILNLNKDMKRCFILLFLILIYFNSFSQNEDLFINIEIIVSDNYGNVLKDVVVYNSKDKLIGITNIEGIALCRTYYNDTIILSHLGFQQKKLKVSEYNLYKKEDNFTMIVILESKNHMLPEVTIVENKPQLAYDNKEVWVLDYTVDHNGIMVVSTDSNNSYLLHLGFNQDTISEKKIDNKLDVLFRDILYQDILGNTHLLTLDSAFQVYSMKDDLQLLYGVSLEKHKSTFGNLCALTDSIIVTMNKYYSGQEILYLSTNRNNGNTRILCDVSSNSREMAKNWHIDDIRLEKATTYKNEFAANEPNYKRPEERDNIEKDMMKRLMLQEIYVPLLNVDNKIYIFDFQKDYIYKYDDEGKYLGKTEISFHLKSKYARRDALDNPWDKKLIYDKARKECYAQFISSGTVTLKKIDLETGDIVSTHILDDHYFPENIQVYDGVVYYQFIDTRMTFGKDCRSLYKMSLL